MKKFKWIIWIVVIAGAGVAIWFWKFREKEKPVVLETEQPHYGYIATSVTATGTIQPVDTVQVGTQVSGTISAVYSDFNATVKKGQLIAQIDKTLLQAQVDQFNANVQQAKSNLTFQESNYNRQKQLLDVGAISKAEYETALNQFNVARDNVNSVASQLRAAQRNMSFTDIYSPINGTVLSRNVNVGQTVAASLNTPTLFVIAKDLAKMQVQAAIDEADIGNVRQGQRVLFTVDAFPDDQFVGTVQEVRLRPSVSSNVVTYVTLIDAPNENMKLKPGMTASVTVYTREEENAMLISAKAIRFRPDSAQLKNYHIEGGKMQQERAESMRIGSNVPKDSSVRKKRSSVKDTLENGITPKRAVVWVKKDSTITRRVIQIGLNDDANVQVLSGLQPNDVVVDAIQQAGAADKASTSSATRSPFMPQRGGRGGGGGGGGGGGARRQ